MMLNTAARSILFQSRHTIFKAVAARSVASFAGPSLRSTVRKASPCRQQFVYKSTAMNPADDTAGRDAYDIARTVEGTDACLKMGLNRLGITGPTKLYSNLTYQELFDHEVANKEGVVAKAEYGDTFTVDTGKFTGRSPLDRWIVLNPGSETAEHMDWNKINQPTTPEVFDELLEKAVAYFNTRETAYVFDGYCGANPETRKNIRFVHEMAWQQHFGMFRSQKIETVANRDHLTLSF